MNTLTIRKVPAEIHRTLRARAAKNGRSTEAEVYAIPESVIAPKPKLGDA
jgi:antitoxin FitA